MKPNAAFNHFVNSVFGIDTLALDETKDNANKIIGAINHSYKDGKFGEFTINLKKRLWRLSDVIKSNPCNRKVLTE